MADLSGLSTNYFATPKEGFTTTLASTISSGAATVPLNSITGYTNGAIATFVVDPTDALKKQAFTGVVDTAGVQLTSVVWTEGTNQTHTTGSTVVDYVTATHVAALVKGLTTTVLTQGGVLKTNAVQTAAQITDGIIGDAEMATSVKPVTLFNENMFDHVVSGGVWTADSVGVNLNASMTAIVVMINGRRISIGAVTARAFTTNVDTYIDVLDNADGTGTLVYTTATTNAASPALAANSMRIGIIQAAATITATTKVNQGQEDKVFPIASSIPYAVTDSLGNLICPRDPNRKVLGQRQIIADYTGGAGSTAENDVTGLSIPVIVPTGRKIVISGFANVFNNNAAANMEYRIKEGATQLASTRINVVNTNVIEFCPFSTQAITPTAGSHTYKLSQISSLTAGPNVSASATQPAFLKVELV